MTVLESSTSETPQFSSSSSSSLYHLLLKKLQNLSLLSPNREQEHVSRVRVLCPVCCVLCLVTCVLCPGPGSCPVSVFGFMSVSCVLVQVHVLCPVS